jgi:hypothetical protein
MWAVTGVSEEPAAVIFMETGTGSLREPIEGIVTV